MAPFSETYAFAGAVAWSEDVAGCGFDARLTADNYTGAATVHGVRRDGPAPLRWSFRVDLSQLTGINLIQGVSIAAAVSDQVVQSGGEANADLLRLSVFGNIQGTQRNLGILAACEGQAQLRCSTVVPLASATPQIGIELMMGAGTGVVRIWVDAPFDQPPTAVLNADNAAWIGVRRLSLGLSSPTPGFVGNQANRTVRFDQIEFDDDQLTWSDFESEGSQSSACAGFPLLGGVSVVANNCAAPNTLPTLASGTTLGPASEFMHQLNAPKSVVTLDLDSDVPGLAAFVCEQHCGPTQRCYGAAIPGTPLILDQLQAGTIYRVIVKSRLPGECGDYALTAFGPLDD